MLRLELERGDWNVERWLAEPLPSWSVMGRPSPHCAVATEVDAANAVIAIMAVNRRVIFSFPVLGLVLGFVLTDCFGHTLRFPGSQNVGHENSFFESIFQNGNLCT